VDSLRLEVADFVDADRWRWLLKDSDSTFVADHQVALDRADPEYLAFADLAGFLRREAVPDRRLTSEADLVARVGAWIGRQVLGEQVGRALVEASPCVVQVVLPLDADFLLYRPLELAYAHTDGEEPQPLAVQDVSLVLEIEGETPQQPKDPVDAQLRMLAVFSLPTEGTALALRRERYELVKLVRQVAVRLRRAVELHVLQYGVTRQRLQEALADGRGWDVLHLSGHGLAGGQQLEQPDGSGDLVHTPELVSLLRPTRRRLKLVTLSSCLSAAATAAETRRWLNLVVPQALEAEADAEAAMAPLPALARELVRRLGCAVLAMRYPVVDDFAITLDQQLYAGLLGRDQELARALQLAVPAAAGPQPTPGAPALSVATPTLLGPLVVGLQLRPPPGMPDFNVGTQKMAFVPDEPERFVGRAGPMARATAALAPENPQVGVVFHGMAGAGKTACALELAYRHEPAFGALVWWKAPEQDREIATSLRDLAVALETQLPGFVMVPAVTNPDALAAFLPRLTQLLEDQAILVVLDNLESLLTDQGGWRDPRWGQLMAALTSHRGASRVVMTSRVRPQGMDEDRVLVEPVHALSLDEALLLARELPNLGRLVRHESPAPVQRGEGDAPSGWTLVRRTLGVVQGHPKLLELADALAEHPEVLAAQLNAADAATSAADRDQLGVFFTRGETRLAEDHFVQVLGQWTRQATHTLPEAAGVLFGILCCVEDPDRTQPILAAVWPPIWRQLGHPDDPPALAETIQVLVGAGLVAAEGDPAAYRLHPGVAEAGRAHAGGPLQHTVDRILADLWQQLFVQARQAEGAEAGGMLLRAGRAAAPYLLRLEDWEAASQLLEQVVLRDQSPGTVQAVLPLLRRIAQATTGTNRDLIDAGVLAKALRLVDPVAAEAQLRAVLERAVTQQRFDLAGAVAGELANLLRGTGRLGEALEVVEQLPEWTRRAGFGPWTQLAGHTQRLQLLSLMGRDEEALAGVQQLRDEMATLPEHSDQEERVNPFNVREATLDVGRNAALNLERWEEALELNAEQVASKQARGAPDYDLARSWFNDYYPLLQLGRLEQARRLLEACQETFAAEGDLGNLGKTLGALASLERRRGRPGEAVRLEQTSLRYAYAAGDPQDIAASHRNLANSFGQAGGDLAQVLAHRLAAAYLYFGIGSGQLPATLDELARDLAAAGEPAPLPASFAELCARVGRVEGVELPELATRLPTSQADDDQILVELVQLARTQHGPARYLEQWQPVIEAVVTAAAGDQQATAELEPVLAELATNPDWAALAGVLGRILAGERGDALLEGLDPIDTAIATVTLERLAAS
jgi:tetratricopeptide (TPR) repeat protein